MALLCKLRYLLVILALVNLWMVTAQDGDDGTAGGGDASAAGGGDAPAAGGGDAPAAGGGDAPAAGGGDAPAAGGGDAPASGGDAPAAGGGDAPAAGGGDAPAAGGGDAPAAGGGDAPAAGGGDAPAAGGGDAPAAGGGDAPAAGGGDAPAAGGGDAPAAGGGDAPAAGGGDAPAAGGGDAPAAGGGDAPAAGGGDAPAAGGGDGGGDAPAAGGGDAPAAGGGDAPAAGGGDAPAAGGGDAPAAGGGDAPAAGGGDAPAAGGGDAPAAGGGDAPAAGGGDAPAAGGGDAPAAGGGDAPAAGGGDAPAAGGGDAPAAGGGDAPAAGGGDAAAAGGVGGLPAAIMKDEESPEVAATTAAVAIETTVVITMTTAPPTTVTMATTAPPRREGSFILKYDRPLNSDQAQKVRTAILNSLRRRYRARLTTVVLTTTAVMQTQAPTGVGAADDATLQLTTITEIHTTESQTTKGLITLGGPEPKRRKRNDATTEDEDGFTVEMSCAEGAECEYIPKQNGQIIPREELEAALNDEEFKAEVKKETGASVVNVDVAQQQQPRVGADQSPPVLKTAPSTWDLHYGLFITIIVLISVCLFLTVVCCLCIRCRDRQMREDKTPMAMDPEAAILPRKQPTAMSSPFTDAELLKGEEKSGKVVVDIYGGKTGVNVTATPPEVAVVQPSVMLQREDSAVTRNGGGQHISKLDEDNGWVVPLDELSKSEMAQPDVENTRF